jgi:hypothetical protein
MQATSEGETRRGAAEVALEWIGRARVGEGVTHERMTLFPLHVDDGTSGAAHASPLAYRTLQEAIADGSVEVTERASASVPELVLHNKGQMMVLVLDGEEIVGGRQNRIVNASFLVAANVTFPLPVTCVEAGRWHEVSARFVPGESSYHSLKRLKHEQVTASLRASGRHTSDQGAVWASVAESASAADVASPTGAMHEIYRSREQDLAAYQQALSYVAGAVGLIVALNGKVAGADLFDQPHTAEVLWAKLVRSYVLDALQGRAGDAAAQEQATRVLERARSARSEVFPSTALGEDVRMEGDGVIGGALVYAETPVHVSLFATEGERTSAQEEVGMARASMRRTFLRRKGEQGESGPTA